MIYIRIKNLKNKFEGESYKKQKIENENKIYSFLNWMQIFEKLLFF